MIFNQQPRQPGSNELMIDAQDKFVVSGDTFKVKDTLKQEGFKYDGLLKKWSIEIKSEDHAIQLVSFVESLGMAVTTNDEDFYNYYTEVTK